MGIKYLWDTNTAIHYLQGQFPPLAEKFIDNILQDSPPAISVITEIELLCWKTPSEKDVVVLKNFIDDSIVYELDQSIKVVTAEIRKAHRVKLPDAIIAATAEVFNLTLLTRNITDFKAIQNLSIIDPWEHA